MHSNPIRLLAVFLALTQFALPVVQAQAARGKSLRWYEQHNYGAAARARASKVKRTVPADALAPNFIQEERAEEISAVEQAPAKKKHTFYTLGAAIFVTALALIPQHLADGWLNPKAEVRIEAPASQPVVKTEAPIAVEPEVMPPLTPVEGPLLLGAADIIEYMAQLPIGDSKAVIETLKTEGEWDKAKDQPKESAHVVVTQDATHDVVQVIQRHVRGD